MASLNEILDVEVPLIKESNTSVVIPPNVSHLANNTIQDDSLDARSNIRLLIAQGSTALVDLLSIAKDGKHPRAYEVIAGLLSTLSELNSDLLTIHQQEQALVQEPEGPVGDVIIQNAVFVGTTAQLGEIIKARRAEERAALAVNTITVCPVTSNTP